ncbi:arrestin domain-containing protein 17 [Culicoides brevitarsis]|uniref:arrestin domain-containing protein 17 n=1 Tax=Culicoides brevitarsis TaxID=469753 RepID=UPI00307BAAAB
MGLKDCQIVLDNQWNTYYAGQTVNGHVEFTFDKPKKVRGIIVKFTGEAHTEWSEEETKKDQEGKEHTETTALSGHEEYFTIQYYLLGSKNAKETEIEAGTHTYPFTCALPPTLPSSFEGKWGHVRYTIKVTLDRPWKFDQDTKMAFTVITPVDLNKTPKCQEPAKLDLEKTFCCFCCKSGPLNVIVHLPVTGFVSGQVMPITAEVDNASNVTVDALKLCLRKNINFMVQQPRSARKREVEKIDELTMGPIEKGGSRTWEQKIEVPALPPSNLVNCGIIDLDYELFVEAQVSGLHKNLSGVIPITLGTVPLSSWKPPVPYTDKPAVIDMPDQDPSMLPTLPASPLTPENPPQGGAIGWGVPEGNSLYPQIPPPTFAESQYKAKILGKNDSEYTRTQDYAPRYPTYSFTPTAPPSNY